MLGATYIRYATGSHLHSAGRLGKLAGLLLLSGILYSQGMSSVASLPLSSDSSDPTSVVTPIGPVTEAGAPDIVLGDGSGVILWPVISKAPSGAVPSPLTPSGQQTKRILGVLPNFEAVSANTHLPPLSLKQKFWLST